MSLKVEYSPDSRRQLIQIELYLMDRFYPEGAREFAQRIADTCDRLNLAPHRGTKCDHLGPGTRRIGFERNVAIYFRVEETRVLILGIHYRGHMPAPF